MDTINIPIKLLEIKEDEGLLRQMVKGNFKSDANGILWISSEDGLFRFDGYHSQNFTDYLAQLYPETFNSKRIYDHFIDSFNTLWMGTPTGIYAYNFDTKRHEHIYLDTDSNVKNYRNFVRYLKPLSPDTLSAYTKNGLYQLDLKSWKVINSLEVNGKLNEAEEVTSTGVFSYNPYVEKDSFYITNIHGIKIIDKKTKKGRLISAKIGNGIDHSYYQPVQYKNYLVYPTYKHGFTFFNLDTKEIDYHAMVKPISAAGSYMYNSVKDCAFINDSTLIFLNENFNFGTINLETREIKISKKNERLSTGCSGFVDQFGYFWPSSSYNIYNSVQPVAKASNPKHYLSIYKLVGENGIISYPYLEQHKQAELADENRKFKLQFALTYPWRAQKLSYRYRVNNGDWNRIGERNYFDLEYFSKDNISVDIEAYNGEELLDSLHYTIHWNIPFYKKRIYQLLFLLLFVAGIILWYRNRIKKIKQQQEIKLEYERQIAHLESMALRSQMNPHFMFNSINSIKGLIINEAAEAAADQLTRFSKLMRSTLNYSAEKSISIKHEIEFLELYSELERFKGQCPIVLQFSVAENVDTQEVKIIPFLIQPFIENCFKHAFDEMGDRKPIIKISFGRKNNYLFVEIDDNGSGIKDVSATVHQSKGTELVEKRLELHNEKKENVSINFRGKGQGTLVSIEIKI